MSDVRIAGYPDNLFAQQVTIPSGASESEMIATQGMALVGIFTPTNGWTDAAIGFKHGWDGNQNALVNAYSNATVLEQCLVSADAAAASISIPFPSPDALFGPFIKLTSGVAGSATPTTQLAARTLTLLFKKYLN